MTTQRKNSLQLLLTTSSNLWQPKERILYNFFLQQVPTYDNPKKEFFTTSSYNKFQLMITQRKHSWKLFLTTSSNLWQLKERILDNFFLQQVPTYDNPKKEFLTTSSSYNKLQLMMTTQRKNFITTCSSYNLWPAMEFCRVCLWCVGKLQLWGVRNPLLLQKPWRKLAVNCFPFFPIWFAFFALQLH